MAYLIAALVFVAYVVVTWLTGSWLHLSGGSLWVLRGGLALLGLAGLGAFLWFYRAARRKPASQPAAGAAGGNEIDLLVREAEARLAGAKLPHGARLGSLPVILLAGETGSTKTSTVLHSGLDPELLAGHVYEDSVVAPTQSANFWFAQRAVFVEAGGPLLGDAGSWKRLVQRLQPSRLGSLAGKGQAARAAVVCFDSDSFLRPGASEAIPAAARDLHARLSELSQSLGIQLPVYVLFTRMDRLPFFADFVRNLSNGEAAEVLGATLPMAPPESAGLYAERQTARLSEAFDALFRSLANLRPDFLSRENDPGRLPGVYEFPREFRKLRGTLVKFLIELCRPSQLSTGPFLRGFYFSGVRPVIMRDVAPAPAASRTEHAGFEAASGATGIFQGFGARPSAQAAAPQLAGTRKVPQWVFLGRLFRDVLLEDRAAMGASGASTKTSVLQRILLATAAVVCIAWAIGSTISWVNNRALQAQAVAAARGISNAESAGNNLPSAAALERLESLRQSLATLSAYKRDGAPWSYRWGLYSGDAMQPQVYRIYFDKFRQLLLAQTQDRLLATLRGLPATPGPEYGLTYDTLKAYLITTSNHDRSTREFLAPVLLDRWSNGREVDPQRLQLAQKQFEFYSEELKYANPFTSENDGHAVSRARAYLGQFAGMERVYQAMLADAAKSNPPINFNKRFPGSAEAVVDTHEVAGPFSKAGWAFMQGAIRNPERYFAGEEWVLGSGTAAKIDSPQLSDQLRARYAADFVAQWRGYLKGASVVKYTNLEDASKKLNLLAGNQSPLLALFSLASQNTAVDDPKVSEAFQPVQAVVPPGNTDKLVAPPNQNYMGALLNLQASLEQIASQPGPVNDAAASQTLANASSAKVTTRQVAQTFRPDPQAHVDATVQKLMEDPITYAEGLLRSRGPAELNARGKALCGQMRSLWSKYPFRANAAAEATAAEVNSVFRKPDGALWAFYAANLQKLLVKQGDTYAASPGAGGIQLTPGFIAFFNQAAGLSEALYANEAQDPHFTYTLKPVPTEGIQTLLLRIDGQAAAFPAGNAAGKQFTWQGGGAHEAQGAVNLGKGTPDLDFARGEGLWAVFHFFDRADRWQPVAGGYQLEWVIRSGRDPVKLPSGNALTVKLDASGLPPLAQRAGAGALACVSEVAR